MKNNLSIVLNVVLLIAVVVLYVLHFSGKSTSEAKNELVNSQINPENFSIAYVNSDSLLKNYDFFKDLEKQLIAKRDKLNIEYQ
ncbi:MAG: OmpH family outer membrane protein, partial [Cyclobacteriaceae bacterium]|nr:OmpH family outer membrane protein [Cyclobacteriaceae bacterium]